MGPGSHSVSVQRSLTILLLVYGLATLLFLLAGASLVAHVTPFSECLLYSHVLGDKIYYGSEYYCYSLGYLFLSCILAAAFMFYKTFQQRRKLVAFYSSGNLSKEEGLLSISSSQITGHATLATVTALLTAAITAGYQLACDNIGDRLRGQLRVKLNEDPNLYRGEKIDERFTDDHSFWKYTGKISNPYGTELYSIRMTCRTIFLDPGVHQQLHDNHVDRYNNYFSYWYQKDLFSYNSQYQAVLTNSLIEASLAGAWLSVLLWGGSLLFMVIQKHYLKKEKRELDKVSLHSHMLDGSMRKDGSVFSGSGYNNGMHSSMSRGPLQRGGFRGSNASMKSTRSRRDVDDLAFASLHGVKPSSTAPSTPGGTLLRNGGLLAAGGGVPLPQQLTAEQASFWEQPHLGHSRAEQPHQGHPRAAHQHQQRRPQDVETEIM